MDASPEIATCRRRALLFPLADLFFFGLEFVVEAAEFTAELELEFLERLAVALHLGFDDFALEEDFALGALGFVEDVEIGEAGLLFRGEAGDGGLLLQALHGEFVSAFHKDDWKNSSGAAGETLAKAAMWTNESHASCNAQLSTDDPTP